MYICELSPYMGYKVYGPYERKTDNRRHVVLVSEDGTKKTVSYPKFIYETESGVKLKANETVDHYDCDVVNNTGSNLFPIDRVEHAKMDALMYQSQTFICEQCNTSFVLDNVALRKLVGNRNRSGRENMTGPFCTRSCSSKASREIQLGRRSYIRHPVNVPVKVKDH